MKKLYMLIALMGLALTVAACGTTNDDNNLPPSNDTVETDPVEPAEPTESAVEDPATGSEGTDTTEGVNGTEGTGEDTETNAAQNGEVSNQEDMQAKMDELAYADFELGVDYADHKEYEAELEKSSNNAVKAEIEDDLNNTRKKGTEAFNELYPLIQQLTIDGQTNQDDAIKEVLEVFNLPADYKEFDLEIRHKDGTKIEFEDRK